MVKCQGKINFGQGKVREFYFRLRVGTLKVLFTVTNCLPSRIVMCKSVFFINL